MNDFRDENLTMPEWLIKDENYIPQSDKDTFVNKSILSLLMVIARIKTQNSNSKTILQVNATLKVVFTFILVLLVSLSRNFTFVIVVTVYLLLFLSIMEAHTIVKILKVGFGMTFFTFFIMLPAVFWGNSFSSLMITSKVFVTITAVSLLSNTTSWGLITNALKRFFIPDTFILVLDVTIKYIVMLGDFTLNMLYSLKLRSVGKNKSKYTSLSGIAGTLFLTSKEMSEEMYHAMECRGFTGEYQVYNKKWKFTISDAIYTITNVLLLLTFFCFGRN